MPSRGILYCKDEENKMKIIITSGYFDPPHIGHIEYFRLARRLGDKLIVILNSDAQARLKYGEPFLPYESRRANVEEFRSVDEVFDSIDTDKSVCKSIEAIAQKYFGNELIFAKGGDRFGSEIPEAGVCRIYGIKIIDGLGEKIEASSRIRAKKK